MGMGDWPEPFYDLGAAGQWNDLDPGNALMYVIEFDTTVEPIQMNLDEPLNRGTQSGVGMIRGWVVSEEPVDRIEVYLDGEYAFDIPYGDPRPDVGAKFPDIESAGTSGFSVPFRYSALSAGEHDVEVVAVDRFGNRSERSAVFDVVRFHKGYIGGTDTPNLDWSYSSTLGDTITLSGVSIGDVGYTIKLKWIAKSQKFEVISIERLSP